MCTHYCTVEARPISAPSIILVTATIEQDVRVGGQVVDDINSPNKSNKETQTMPKNHCYSNGAFWLQK